MIKISIIIVVCLNLSNAFAKNTDLKVKLNSLKKQTVKIHNEILLNNKELKKIVLLSALLLIPVMNYQDSLQFL